MPSTNKYPSIKSQVDSGPGVVRPRLEWNVPFDFASLLKKKRTPQLSPAFMTVTRKQMETMEQRETLETPRA
jgi:hypothetical protein